MSGLERKNGWSLAEFAGDATPDGMQRLLNHARWDADQVREHSRPHEHAAISTGTGPGAAPSEGAALGLRDLGN
ncbi:hypothetical protein [Actinomadura livida]|uniref:Uncharacterized protein n=1 Tax=Actinomadura livida TaxID=79909 RepID=A0A7W7I966_9ACTN|nr:hypothetical protein [Actinomadura catellatispora]GGU12367.1 hypothetical protein GCM10010208_41400 [Actinomadura livida]